MSVVQIPYHSGRDLDFWRLMLWPAGQHMEVSSCSLWVSMLENLMCSRPEYGENQHAYLSNPELNQNELGVRSCFRDT